MWLVVGCRRRCRRHQPSTTTSNHQPPTANHQRPATNHQPPTTNHQPPTTNHQPPTTNHQQPTANHQPPTTNHQPPTTNQQPQTTHQFWNEGATTQPQLPKRLLAACQAGIPGSDGRIYPNFLQGLATTTSMQPTLVANKRCSPERICSNDRGRGI